MIDPDSLIPLADLPALIPQRDGRKVHVASTYRWVKRGIGGIRLRAVQVGGRRCTTKEWLSEFFAALSERSGLEQAPPPRSPARRDREHARADAALAAAGW
ncbi:MAG TPA: DUF1580 domain-containing protein [Pirellulales bacterium]|nr:DUF1580 domain-containing protein [Pirellulales bacterium]